MKRKLLWDDGIRYKDSKNTEKPDSFIIEIDTDACDQRDDRRETTETAGETIQSKSQ